MERGLKRFPLTETRRCPKSHVQNINWLLPEFSALPEAPEGVIEGVNSNTGEMFGTPITVEQATQRIAEGDMVQSRTNAPLASFCWGLLRRGLKVQIAGRDIGANLVALIKRTKASDIPQLIERVEEYRAKELAKADKKRNSEAAAENVNNKCDTIIALTEGIDSIPELIRFIQGEEGADGIFRGGIFADVNEAGVPKQSVLLTTTHKAKGLEAENVWILDPSKYPSSYAKQDWQIMQENNLIVVRDTRSKRFLGYISGQPSTRLESESRKPKSRKNTGPRGGCGNPDRDGRPEPLSHGPIVLYEGHIR